LCDCHVRGALVAFLDCTCCMSSPRITLKVEVLLKTDSGHPKDAGVAIMGHHGKPWEFIISSLVFPLQSRQGALI